MWYHCEVLQKRESYFFSANSVLQLPKKRVMFKYSEYIFKNEVSLSVITLTGKCLKHAHAQIWHVAADERGCFFWYTFLKPCWEMLPFFLPTFAADLNPFKASFVFFGVRNCFSMWYYWRKTQPKYEENLAVFQEPCSCTEHSALCSDVWGTRCWAAHTHSSAYEWEVLSECWQPRGQIYPSEHILNCSPVLGNWELVLTAVGKSSICWVTWIPAQP